MKKMFLCTMLAAAIKWGWTQDTMAVKKNLSAQQFLLAPSAKDSAVFSAPKYRQGFFCNFEDRLNRKKVPLDFSLGKSKY
jgi:hypothetical protein